MRKTLEKGLQLLELELPEAAKDTLCTFGEDVIRQNAVMNLTAITEPEKVALLHLTDSLTLLKTADLRGKRIIDVGCGAGFPGVPVKIACPEAKLTLLDSLGKRMTWLSGELQQLGVEAECVTARAEEAVAERRESYDFAYQHYQDVKAELEVVNSDLNAYKLAEEGIMSLKSKIKSYVVPSLQKEASRLVSEMTNAELNEVNITDDFDITVNGKELALLSGSEKAVANLAIRLGLGCVLTRKVFNVFMGDEIDESMSEERAERVAESLHRLLGTIDQIILISHKDITADYYFSVDNV